jgi:hypothetical protein
METEDTPTQKDSHQTILRLISALFSAPYLPLRLLSFLAVVILTDFAYVLLREPLAYWYDYSREAVRPIGGFNFGPLPALGLHILYIAVVWGVLRILNRKVSFVLWFGLLLLHLSTFILVPPVCNYDLQRILPAWLCYFNRDLVTFVIGLIIGLVLSKSIFPPEQEAPAVVPPGVLSSRLGLSKFGVAFSVVWLLFLGVGVGIASHLPTTGWRPLITENVPAPRYEMMVAYNTKQNKAILFGGTLESSPNNWTRVNETWEWDGQDWKQLNPAKSPPPRSRGGLAYDPKRDVIVLFGGWNDLGRSLSDTWEWDGETWNEVGKCEGCTPPPARGCHNMYYDTVREIVIMYGGCNENQYFFNDAWSWDGTRWSWVDVRESPVASGAPIIYDSKNQWAVGFLAWQPSGTWIWDKNGWSKQALTAEPPLRGGSMMAHDPATGDNLMFGGTLTSNSSTTFFIDTWMLNGTTWREIKESSKPPGRWGHALFFDTKLNKFIMFGGFDGRTALNDLWQIDPAPDE